MEHAKVELKFSISDARSKEASQPQTKTNPKISRIPKFKPELEGKTETEAKIEPPIESLLPEHTVASSHLGSVQLPTSQLAMVNSSHDAVIIMMLMCHARCHSSGVLLRRNLRFTMACLS